MDSLTNLKNEEAEKEVLADLISDENTYNALAHEVNASVFTNDACRKCYAVIEELIKEGKVPEISEVGMRLMPKGVNIADFMQVGNNSYIITRQRIELLKNLAFRRENIVLHQKAVAVLENLQSNADDYQQILTQINHGGEDANPNGVITFGEASHELLNQVALRMQGKGDVGIHTGLRIFDARGGFHEGDLVVIAAETSQGKSTLASTMAFHMAKCGVPVAYYSLEMGASQLTARMFAKDSGLPSTRILYDQHLSDEEFNRLYDSSALLEELPIYYDDANKTSFAKICTSIRAMVRKRDIKVAFVDYLQILSNGKSENREAIIADMARNLKNLAVELGICIVALSQLNRDAANHEPAVSRIRGSGEVAEAADIVALIYRPEVYGIETYKHHPTKGLAEITIAKGRNIGSWQELVKFNGELSYFEDCTNWDTIREQSKKRPWD